MTVAGLLLALVAAAPLVRRSVSDHYADPDRSRVPVPTGQASRGQLAAEAAVQLEDGGTHPGRLRLDAGGELELFVQNSSTAEHHFIVTALEIHEDLLPGSSAQVVVSDLRRGTYRSWCAFDGHREHVTFVVV